MDQQERARAALAEMRKAFDTQGELAHLLGVKQQTISNALRNGPIGVKLARSIAKVRAQSFEDLLTGKPKPRQFADLESWHPAAALAIAERRATPYAVSAVARWPVFLEIERAEPRLVADLAALWTQWTPLEVRTEAERDASTVPTTTLHGSGAAPEIGGLPSSGARKEP
jgi:DNA-binding XRE family transcriptional regulator